MKTNDIRRPWQKEPYGNRTDSNPFYRSSEWRACRKAYLTANPRCCECGGRATMLDHKIQIRKGGAKTDWNNLQGMCDRCHAKKSQREAQVAKKEKKNSQGQGGVNV